MKKNLISLISMPIAIPAITFVASCNNSSSSVEETVEKDNISAEGLGFANISANEFAPKVNSDWVYENISKLLTNTQLIENNKNCIVDVKATVNDFDKSSVNISFVIKAGFTYDKDGKVNNEKALYNITIKGFATFDEQADQQEFINAVLESGFNNFANLINDNTQAINLGNTQISIENQKKAIVSYINKLLVVNPDKNVVNENKKEWNYRIAFTAKVNSYVKKIFGLNWIDILNGTENKDLKNINQVIFGFKLETKQTNTSKDGVAEFWYRPQFLQFSWTTSSKPYWLKDTSIRIPINVENEGYKKDQLINVKNLTSGQPGELVSK